MYLASSSAQYTVLFTPWALFYLCGWGGLFPRCFPSDSLAATREGEASGRSVLQNYSQRTARACGALCEHVAISDNSSHILTPARWADLETLEDRRSLFFFFFFPPVELTPPKTDRVDTGMSSFEQWLKGEEIFVQLYSAALPIHTPGMAVWLRTALRGIPAHRSSCCHRNKAIPVQENLC